MLLELTVTDLALIERVRGRFGEGFTVITGETGAGKSLLIDALGLVLGARADTGLVRSGAALARVEALFDRADDPAADPLICARELGAAGRSIARLDDDTVTAGRLADVVGPLVEVHGQHDPGRLLTGAWQRSLLDASEPAPVAAMEERLGLLCALFRKYGEGEEAVLAHGEAATAEAERLRGREVFDEVDAGIGGRSADPVGRSLWRLARDHQVICITHLPQIAAYADGHVQIRKVASGGRTVTEVRELDDEERIDELASMLGGAPSDGAARAAARELVARAAAARGQLSGVA